MDDEEDNLEAPCAAWVFFADRAVGESNDVVGTVFVGWVRGVCEGNVGEEARGKFIANVASSKTPC